VLPVSDRRDRELAEPPVAPFLVFSVAVGFHGRRQQRHPNDGAPLAHADGRAKERKERKERKGDALRMQLELARLDGEPDEACKRRGIRRTFG